MGENIDTCDFNVTELVTGLLGRAICWDKRIRTTIRLMNEDDQFSLGHLTVGYLSR